MADPKAESPAPAPSADSAGGRETETLFLARLGDAGVRAAEKFAFPLILAILVILFLLVQNQMDRKDPKLALAPLRSSQETVVFE